MSCSSIRSKLIFPSSILFLVLILLMATPRSVRAQTLTTLYSFTGINGDGAYPFTGVVVDPEGNLYGTTNAGGERWNYGTAYVVRPSGEETVLHAFSNGPNAYPLGSLILDTNGNLYGTTYGWSHGNHVSYGTVFELTTTNKEKVLYNFKKTFGANGWSPAAGLLMDGRGHLYGTTEYGGASFNGTVFQVTAKGQETVLHSFDCNTDGCQPEAPLVMDGNGNLFGTTIHGGTFANGTVFELTASGTESVLYNFGCGSDGCTPYGGLVFDGQGNLFGTTRQGAGNGCGGGGCGTVFKLTPDGRETVLYRFTGGTDGGAPFAGLILDGDGNLYGTTFVGGDLACGSGYGCGTVFKIGPSGSETVLYAFAGGVDGAAPYGGVVRDPQGNLYGTTLYGGLGTCAPGGAITGCGVVFKLTP